jgi:CheY-like chemotaxis protein
MGGGKMSKILLVDDNEDDIFLFKRALEKSGISAELGVVYGGEEAIEYLRKVESVGVSAMPNLVLLDIKMPGVGGFDVLKWIRQRAAFMRVPVVILSASSRGEDLVRAMQLGANSVIIKPSDLDDLAKMIGIMGRYWFEVHFFVKG